MVGDVTRSVCGHLTANTLRPARPISVAGPSRTTTHSLIQDRWPSNWAIDKPAFRKSVRRFEKATEPLRDLLFGPFSTGNTPVASPTGISPTVSPPPSDSREESTATDTAAGSNSSPRRPSSQTTPEMAGNFTPQQLQDMINNAVNNAVTTAINNLQLPAGPRGERGPPGDPGEPGSATVGASSSDSKWNAAELGYFDPHLDKSYGEGEIVTVGKDVYYRSVILFVERIHDLAAVKGEAVVRTNVNTCFRGSALAWYTSELSNLERRGLRAEGSGVDEWCRALSARFKELPGVALSNLTAERYTLADARARREPASYVQAVVRHAKSADIDGVQNQLTFAYQGIVPELRVFVDPPNAATTIASFIQMLDMKKVAWFELHTRQQQHQAFAQRSQNQHNQQNQRGNAYRNATGNAFQSQSNQYSNPNPFRQGQQNQFTPVSQPFGQQQQYGQPYRQQQPYRPSNSFGQNTYRPPQYGYQPNPRYDARPQQDMNRRPFVPSGGMPNRLGLPQQQANQLGQDRKFGNQSTGNRQFQQNLRPKAAAYQTTADEEMPEQAEENTLPQDAAETDQFNQDQEQIEPEFEEYDEQFHDSFAGFVGIQTYCRNCDLAFSSKSKLHKHLRSNCSAKALPSPPEPSAKAHAKNAEIDAFAMEVIQSDSKDRARLGTGFSFRGWNYAHFPLRFVPTAAQNEEGCADSGTGVSLADKQWLLSLLPDVQIRKMTSSLRVKGLGSAMHDTDEYVLIPMYLPGVKTDGNKALACVTREIHLVNGLKANLLMGNDIMGPEEIVLDVSKNEARIGSCDITISISTRQQNGQYTKRPIRAQKAITIAPRAQQMLPVITPKNLPDRDFIFEPAKQHNLTVYAHMVDSNIAGVIVKNETDHAVQIPKKLRLGTLQEMDYENVFFAAAETAKPKGQSWIKKAATFAAVTSMSLAGSFSSLVNHASEISSGFATESKLSNGVMVYGNEHEKQQLSDLVDEFPSLWKDEGFAKVPQDEWMKLSLRDDWQSRLPSSKRAKVYPLGLADKAVVDKTFDALHDQGRLEYTKQPTPFSYPVFVVWKTLPNGDRKGRAVVDIRGLNNLIVPDVYPVPLQSDIIAKLLGCTHLAVLDAVSFFYQWLVHPDSRHMLTVVTHRGQETFNVPIMGCMNSIAYVQRRIDHILRALKDFAQAYIDDIVVGSGSFEEHIYHLKRLFQLLVENNISIAPEKTFLGYPNVNLLGRHVDSLGMATAEDKLKAISKLSYPATLGDLEHYLGLTGYLRSSVHYYAQLAAPLQNLKTRLLKEAPTKGNPRRAYSSRFKLPLPSDAEKASFESLQDALSQSSILVHHDPNRPIWVDLDASKEFGFGAQVFHVKECNSNSNSKSNSNSNSNSAKWPPRNAIQTIMFLSRGLTQAERNYWPTELEVAGFVWVLKKIRHLVDSSKHATIIQTDHSAILDIMKQSSITSTNSTMRMNVRLIRASQFLKQFRLDVRHKPGKEHIVPDALSRLASANGSPLPEMYDELDALFTTALVEMSPTFLQGLEDGYKADPFYVRIAALIAKNEDANEDVVGLSFVRGKHIDTAETYQNLFFHVSKLTGVQRLCIPQSMIKTVLEIAHGDGHLGFERSYERIASAWYIHGLVKHLRQYIRFCPQCLILQTRRHRPYGSLQPIESPSVPFHTLTLDFILALPRSHREGFDTILSVTDKFTKRVTFVPGKKDYSAAQWATTLLDRLDTMDWGIPRILLTDRDRKFLSELWTELFKKLGVELLYSTAYHPQTDGSSERTNQTAEIALRFYMHTMPDPALWPTVLPRMQAQLNNSISATTNKTPNELAYGFQPHRPLDLLRDASMPQPVIARIDAADAISFAQTNQKHHYDRKHQPMFLKQGEWAYLRLHKGYSIPAAVAITTKLSQQYVGPFEILEKVGKQAYKLAIPGHWRVHPVFSIAQLEPAPAPGSDPYKRPVPDQPGSVYVEGDTDEFKSWEVERILNKRVIRKGRGWATQYLIRWLGYGPEFDQWYNQKDLANSADLIQQYENAMTAANAI